MHYQNLFIYSIISKSIAKMIESKQHPAPQVLMFYAAVTYRTVAPAQDGQDESPWPGGGGLRSLPSGEGYPPPGGV